MEVRIYKKFYDGVPEGFDSFCKRSFGSSTAKLIARRIQNATAADNLSILIHQGFPGRQHWLTGNRKYQISADLKDLKRLIFVPLEEVEKFVDESGNLDNKKVLCLIIVEVADTHNE